MESNLDRECVAVMEEVDLSNYLESSLDGEHG